MAAIAAAETSIPPPATAGFELQDAGAACIPNGQPSQDGTGDDCCSGTSDENDLCFTCTASGQPSGAGDGSDCCSGNIDNYGNCL